MSVQYATADATASAAGTASTGGSDYVASSGTLTFAAGITTQRISVTIDNDTVFEVDETFNVNLSGATNASISDAQGTGTITNDEAAPAITITDVTITEGNAGTQNDPDPDPARHAERGC